jgi:hypothetical protein
MKGCNTVQCLVRKSCDGSEWNAINTDQNWELNSNFFLSGLSGYMPRRSLLSSGSNHIPVRHGASQLYPDTQFRLPQNVFRDNVTPLPFHPTCFEIFSRVSRLRLGHVDANGLAAWRRYADITFNNEHLDRDPAVCRGAAGRKWRHVHGDEWIVANPVLIPLLPGVLQPGIMTDGSTIEPRDSPFSVRKDWPAKARLIDPFRALPQEILDFILKSLSSKDIAALRLSSRAFTHLPFSLFADLLKNEMPWLWEAWDQDTPTSPWAMQSWAALKEADDKLQKELRHHHVLRHFGIDIEMPEDWCTPRPGFNDLFSDVVSAELHARLSEMEEPDLICKLQRDQTDWFKVYNQIKKYWKVLKGLRNRERIWKDCEQIVKEIMEMREHLGELGEDYN